MSVRWLSLRQYGRGRASRRRRVRVACDGTARAPCLCPLRRDGFRALFEEQKTERSRPTLLQGPPSGPNQATEAGAGPDGLICRQPGRSKTILPYGTPSPPIQATETDAGGDGLPYRQPERSRTSLRSTTLQGRALSFMAGYLFGAS